MSLFRTEAIEAQRRKLIGAATLHQPVRFSVFTAVVVATTVVGLSYAATATFVRKETVQGTVVPEAGLADVVAPRSGTVTRVRATVGTIVERGAPLVEISTDLSSAKGDLSLMQQQQSRARMAELDLQLTAQKAKTQGEYRRLTDRANALTREVGHLRQVRVYQAQQLALVEQQRAHIGPLVEQGYASILERDRRDQVVLSQRQALEDIDRQIESRDADARDMRAQAAEIALQEAAASSELRSSKASLEQGINDLDAQGGSIIRAPISGTVTAINVSAGSAITPASVLFSVAPNSSPLRAEIFIPTRAAGFVAEGQKVRLMVDAFPYQRFGMLNGEIAQVHRTPIALPAAEGKEGVSAYRAWVRIDRPYVVAYQKRQALRPGMTVTADIVTSRQTVLQALLDPILAAKRLVP
jgi:membrane fusion protein